MLPAHECFNSEYVPTEAKLRLVVKQKITGTQALTQFGVNGGIGSNNRLHGRVKKTQGIASSRFCLVHRQISLLEQVAHVLFAFAKQRHANAACAFMLQTSKIVGLTQGLQNPLRNIAAVFGGGKNIFGQALQHHDKLVTTQSRNGVAQSDTSAQTRSDLAQQHISRRVTKGVVKHLEIIQINEHQRTSDIGGFVFNLGASLRQGSLQPLHQHLAVG